MSSRRSLVVILALLLITAMSAAATMDSMMSSAVVTEPTPAASSALSMSLATPIPLTVRTPEALSDTSSIIPPTPVGTVQVSTTPVPGAAVPSDSAPPAATSVPPVVAPALPQPQPVRVVDAPLRLRVPALGIDSAVQWVGVDEEGRMGVPSNYIDVAWYELGTRPGMPGNAVIAGHLDSTTGPAVFYQLERLRPGDDIYVTTHSGEEIRFVVEGTEAYHVNDAPLERIFGPSQTPRLNLITCDGTFDWSRREYDQRLVVFAVAG